MTAMRHPTALPDLPPVSGRSGDLSGRRGVPERVILRTTVALAPCIEGVALADECIASMNRILMAAAAGSRHAVVNEAGRMSVRATAARVDLRQMAHAIEPVLRPAA